MLVEKSRACLDSLKTLLSGEFPADLKEDFFRDGQGLFPSPSQITLKCSCPDWARMCKHVAATLYGVAVRLDEKPELFFTLRGMNVQDFVGTMVREESRKFLGRAQRKNTRALSGNIDDVAGLFGISMDSPAPGGGKLKKAASKIGSAD